MNITSRGAAGCFAALLMCVMTSQTGHAQAPPSGVFSTLRTDLVPEISIALEPATMRSRVVQVDTGQVTAARLGRETLRLNLFDDADVAVRIDRVRPTRSGYFITGHPEGVEWGEVRLVVNGPVMVGTVVTPDGTYTIRFGGSGRHVIRQVDPSAESLENDEAELDLLPSAPPETGSSIDPFGSTVRPASAMAEDTPTEDGSEVRVLVVYTPALQAEQSGAAGMQAVIDLMIQSANHAFEISGINPRLVLAHTALVDYVETDRSTDLGRLRSPDDGYMDEVHALRNEHAADLIHLLTGGLSFSGGGIANRLRKADLRFADFAAFALTQGTSETIFTHEIGHNFGLLHDRFVDLDKTSIYPYAFGYANNRAFEPGAPATARWQTIMAYPHRCSEAGFGCQSLLRFSNPDQTWLGDPLGVPADDPATGSEGPADARLTINRTARWVGSFRSEACTQFTVSPEAPVVPVGGSEIILKVETTPGCLWDASSESAFLTPETEIRHSGTGFVSISAEPNETGAERNGTVNVAGTTVDFRQLAIDAGICSRTFRVAQAISGNVSCDEVDDQRLNQVTSLRLDAQGLTSLKAGDLDGLSNLVTLSLENNRFTELPEDLFTGLSSLESLSLVGNRLTELPAGLFAGLLKLRSLRLNLNGLESLPEGVFAGLSGLRALNLSNNELSEISEDTFTGLTRLQNLSLEHNNFSAFAVGTFAGLAGLVTLDLGNNSFDTLPIGLFSGPDNLQLLSLGSSRLSSLPEDIFAGLSKLKSLSLQGSPLSELPPGLFRGLSSIETLIIYHTVMPSFPEAVFSDLTALEHLLLRWNKLNSLPPGVFAELRALRRLNLADNQLTSLPNGIFSGLTSLESLSLEGNPVDPMQLELTLEEVGDNQFKAVAPTGAPFGLSIQVSSNGGTIEGNADTVTIPTGAVEGSPIRVSRNAGTQQRVTVDIGMLPGLPDTHSGYLFEKDENLPVEILPALMPNDPSLRSVLLNDVEIAPTLAADTTRYTTLVENAVSSIAVAVTPNHPQATVAFFDVSDGELADADSSKDGFQAALRVGENTINVKVTSQDETATQTYVIVVTRDGAAAVCSRTAQVREAIMADISGVGVCALVTESQLSGIAELDLSGAGLSALTSGDFAGLSGLQTLRLADNMLSALPNGIFSGLAALQTLSLGDNQMSRLPQGLFAGLTELQTVSVGGNTVDPLPLSISLENVDEGRFKAVAPTGAPFALELPLSVSSGGEIEGGTNIITIPAGAVESPPLVVARVAGERNAVTVDIGTLPPLPADHRGYVLEKDATLPIEIPLPDVTPPPAQVAGVEVTPGIELLEVAWTAVPDADGYKVQWKSGEEDFDGTRQAVVSGADTVSYTITGLTAGMEHTVRVIATGENVEDGPPSEEITDTPRSGDPDVNGDGVLDTHDAQVMLYAFQYESLVGDGETGGTAEFRQRFLAGYSGRTDPSDDDLRTMLRKANAWRTAGVNEGGDINDDGVINGSDAYAMYYAYAFESLLGNGDEGGTARFRSQLLGPLAGTADPTDEDLKDMLRRANRLRKEFNQ